MGYLLIFIFQCVVCPCLRLKMLELNELVIAQLKVRGPAFPDVTEGVLVPQVSYLGIKLVNMWIHFFFFIALVMIKCLCDKSIVEFSLNIHNTWEDFTWMVANKIFVFYFLIPFLH